MRKILLIPGFGGRASEKPFSEVVAACRKFAEVHTYNPKWNRSTAADWIAGAKQAAEKIGLENLEVVGFSLGAYVALVLAAEFELGGVVLCSLSPYFAEQYKEIPTYAWKFLGKRRRKDFEARPSPKKLRSPSAFLFGSRDWKLGIRTAEKLANRYGGSFALVDDVGHELTPAYLDQILAVLRKRK